MVRGLLTLPAELEALGVVRLARDGPAHIAGECPDHGEIGWIIHPLRLDPRGG